MIIDTYLYSITYICENLHMIGAKIQQTLIAAGKQSWVMTGKKLNPYQKQILADNGLSTRKFTALLYDNRDQPFSFVVKLCKALDIKITDLV